MPFFALRPSPSHFILGRNIIGYKCTAQLLQNEPIVVFFFLYIIQFWQVYSIYNTVLTIYHAAKIFIKGCGELTPPEIYK